MEDQEYNSTGSDTIKPARPAMTTMLLTEEQFLQTLDKMIDFWRAKQKSGDPYERSISNYYIDAYQSVRVNCFGKTKDLEPIPAARTENVVVLDKFGLNDGLHPPLTQA